MKLAGIPQCILAGTAQLQHTSQRSTSWVSQLPVSKFNSFASLCTDWMTFIVLWALMLSAMETKGVIKLSFLATLLLLNVVFTSHPIGDRVFNLIVLGEGLIGFVSQPGFSSLQKCSAKLLGIATSKLC